MSLSADLKNRLAFALTSQSAADEMSAAVDANTNLADGLILIGDTNGVQAEKAVSGDITMTREGVTAIGAAKVLAAMIAAGAAVPSKLGLVVINKTGSDIAVDQVVAVTTLDTTSGVPKIVLADADVAAHDNLFVTSAAIANNAQGTVVRSALSAANLNTNAASAAGDAVYLDTTAGGFTVTPPSTAVSRVHQVGMVVVKSATVGQILWLTAPARIIGTNELQAAAVTLAKIAPNAIDGTIAKNSASADVIGALPVVFQIKIADASADTDVVTTHKIKVLDFWFQATGIAAHASLDTIQLKSTASAITDAIAKTATVNKVVRASTIDPANATIAAGGTIRVTAVKNTNAAGVAYVLAVRSA